MTRYLLPLFLGCLLFGCGQDDTMSQPSPSILENSPPPPVRLPAPSDALKKRFAELSANWADECSYAPGSCTYAQNYWAIEGLGVGVVPLVIIAYFDQSPQDRRGWVYLLLDLTRNIPDAPGRDNYPTYSENARAAWYRWWSANRP